MTRRGRRFAQRADRHDDPQPRVGAVLVALLAHRLDRLARLRRAVLAVRLNPERSRAVDVEIGWPPAGAARTGACGCRSPHQLRPYLDSDGVKVYGLGENLARQLGDDISQFWVPADEDDVRTRALIAHHAREAQYTHLR